MHLFISDRMVDAARAAARRERLAHASFERMDAENLTLEDGSVDVALCALGLMYVPDPVRALSEMHRVLGPGGRALSVVWGVFLRRMRRGGALPLHR